ncbi:MAG: hypothetical protein MZW92_58490 [Comamonadaceae bacterium]|nr:hypothetical protein [Comamonadaceae bacterium]
MPDFWQFPTGSMGLGPLQRDLPGALHALPGAPRPRCRPSGRKVWGVRRRRRDGRARVARRPDAGRARGARQPDLRRQLQPAAAGRPGARQRLDHPGAGRPVRRRRLERHQAAVGQRLGPAVRARHAAACCCARFARDGRRRVPDAAPPPTAAYNREHFFGQYPELQQLVAHLTDDDIDRLQRGGHDPVKIHAAYHAARAPPRPADGDPGQDQEGLRHGRSRPGPHDHAPAEEARRRRAAATSATASRCR